MLLLGAWGIASKHVPDSRLCWGCRCDLQQLVWLLQHWLLPATAWRWHQPQRSACGSLWPLQSAALLPASYICCGQARLTGVQLHQCMQMLKHSLGTSTRLSGTTGQCLMLHEMDWARSCSPRMYSQGCGLDSRRQTRHTLVDQ